MAMGLQATIYFKLKFIRKLNVGSWALKPKAVALKGDLREAGSVFCKFI
jgi:hypothetical protein